ncbi:alcohol dehydrogenase catalytic domain-containing protein [Rhizobium sp.]|uniref:zinc-dependent alcohol dehydrogenase n=1 Tax=Rhizobium sp. TaxID=391 RepID=UPI0028B1A113
MKAVVYSGAGQLVVEDLESPQGEGALVAVEACGICGTDLTIFAGKHPRSKPPLVIGHEFVGRVTEPTPGSKLIAGTRVTCFPLYSCGHCEACTSGLEHVCETLRLVGIDGPGGMAEAVRLSPDLLYPVPDDLPAIVAAQAEPVAVCVHAANVGSIKGGEAVAIIGAGPIGITLAILLRQRGVAQIVISDTNQDRLSAARDLGFLTVTAGEKITDALEAKSGFDVVFECAGAGAAVNTAVACARVGGRIVIVSIHKSPQPVDLQALSFRELQILGTRVYTRLEFLEAIALLPAMANDLSTIVSSVVPFEGAQQAFEKLVNGAPDLKIIVDTTGD